MFCGMYIFVVQMAMCLCSKCCDDEVCGDSPALVLVLTRCLPGVCRVSVGEGLDMVPVKSAQCGCLQKDVK